MGDLQWGCRWIGWGRLGSSTSTRTWLTCQRNLCNNNRQICGVIIERVGACNQYFNDICCMLTLLTWPQYHGFGIRNLGRTILPTLICNISKCYLITQPTNKYVVVLVYVGRNQSFCFYILSQPVAKQFQARISRSIHPPNEEAPTETGEQEFDANR